MALALTRTQNLSKSSEFDHFMGESYELALKQAIENFLNSVHKPNTDFSVLSSTFHRLLHSRVDPPLETIWFFSAVTFLDPNSPKDEPWDRFSRIKDLLDWITSCSASCSSSKEIVLVAPVIYNLYGVIVDSKGNDLRSKREKKLKKEIKSLIDIILGYINICCTNEDDSGSDGLTWPLEDLVSVWIGDKMVENEGGIERLKLFFPLLSDEIVRRICIRECGVNELAGVVIAEAFLLRLCMDFRPGMGTAELQKELRSWAVGSIAGFRNLYFFETLVMQLLEPTLSVTSLLNSEDDVFLRNVLYDAVILVDYSFLNHERGSDLTTKLIQSLGMTRLVVAHEAIDLCLKRGDHSKAISYMNAFSSSHLQSQLIKWVKSETNMQDKPSGPKGRTPKAFLNWFLHLENQGIRLMDDHMSKFCAKLVLENLEEDYKLSMSKTEKESGADLFYIDNKGEAYGSEEDGRITESMNATFVAAAHTMLSVENGRRKKRKEIEREEKRKQVKLVKHELYDDSGSSSSDDRSIILSEDGSDRDEREVKNPLCDEDVDKE